MSADAADTANVAVERVGPPPGPPPERIDVMVALDLLATARRWRVRDAFVCGQADGLSRALVACLNAGDAPPIWLRRALLEYLLGALWEQSPVRQEDVDRLLATWSASS